MEPRDKNGIETWNNGVFLDGEFRSHKQDLLPLSGVRAIQSLAMGVLSEQARRLNSREKMTGFVLFDTTGEGMGSNTLDTYMGVVSRRPAVNYWQFTVSFLSGIMNNELRYSNTRELYRFNWDSTGKCLGTLIVNDNYNPVISTQYDTEHGLIDTVDPNATSYWRPIEMDDCLDVVERMSEVTERVKARAPKRFGADWSRMG